MSAGAAFDVFLAGADRTRLPVVLEASPVLDDQARTAGCVATAHVVGALTQHDPLTGLPNSAAYLDRAARTLGSHRQGCAIMLIELDRFDLVRAAIGNTASDALLVEASRRLREVFEPTQEGGRATDCFLGYLGGSQFGTIILAPLADSFSALHLAESARRMLSAPYPEHDGIHVRTSIGVAMDNQAHKGQQLFLAATTALRRAQEAGGGRVEILGEAASEQAMNQLRLEIDLRAAVDGGAVQLHYQPEIDLRTGRLLGFEALARWQHARLGAISPARFIGLAEESGMIESLGRDLLRLGCTQARTWQERHRAPELSIAVNISEKQLRAGFVAEVTSVLTETGLEPTSLVLEVTETAAMSDPESTVSILDELRAHGVRFALDDFGTGYSSLAYLTRMRFDQLKLDRGFVEGMRTGGPDAVVAQSIIALGHSLDIPVLAEGIEHRDQAEMLIELGCEQGQGYLFSRPLSPESAGVLLDQVRDADYVVGAPGGPGQ